MEVKSIDDVIEVVSSAEQQSNKIENAKDGTISDQSNQQFSVFSTNATNEKQLKEIQIGSNITSFEDGLFEDIQKLQKVVCTNQTKIVKKCFKGCKSLEYVKI